LREEGKIYLEASLTEHIFYFVKRKKRHFWIKNFNSTVLSNFFRTRVSNSNALEDAFARKNVPRATD
jgi:hypothetical protein